MRSSCPRALSSLQLMGMVIVLIDCIVSYSLIWTIHLSECAWAEMSPSTKAVLDTFHPGAPSLTYLMYHPLEPKQCPTAPLTCPLVPLYISQLCRVPPNALVPIVCWIHIMVYEHIVNWERSITTIFFFSTLKCQALLAKRILNKFILNKLASHVHGC